MNKAFSLIELLVAIAVVAIITVLGTAALSAARRGADNTKCVANLRAGSQAMLAYFHDRDGWFFPGKNWFQYPSTKPLPNSGMRDYFGVTETTYDIYDPSLNYDTVITCPAMKRKYPQLYPQALNRGHAINVMLNVKDPDKKYDSFPSSERPKLSGGHYRLSSVPNPARMWMLTDSAVNGGLLGSISVNTAESGDGKYLSMPHHGEIQNIVFLDGHVERITREEFVNPRNKRDFWGNTTLPSDN